MKWLKLCDNLAWQNFYDIFYSTHLLLLFNVTFLLLHMHFHTTNTPLLLFYPTTLILHPVTCSNNVSEFYSSICGEAARCCSMLLERRTAPTLARRLRRYAVQPRIPSSTYTGDLFDMDIGSSSRYYGARRPAYGQFVGKIWGPPAAAEAPMAGMGPMSS